jgi:hypothetical protein
LSSLSTTNFSTLILCILILSTISFAAAPDRITGSIDSGQMVQLARSLHPKVQPQYDQGAVDPQFKFSYVTLLTSPSASQQRALDKVMADQQNPSSPNYHKWLTPEQYAERFGLSQNDISKISTWLKAQGFTVLSVAPGRNSIILSGTAGQFERAFQTEIHHYNVDGESHFANATPLKIPAAWSGIVTVVRGLHNFQMKPLGVRRMPGLHPSYYDSALNAIFAAPGDVATIYDIGPLYTAGFDGTGQKLAIIGQTDIYLSDINDFRSGFGLSQISGCTTNTSGVVTACNSSNFQYIWVPDATYPDPGAPDTCGDLAEADLDVEWSGATARNAQIIFVNSPAIVNPQCTTLLSGGVENALSYAIQHTVAPVVSMSYGICELYANSDETELQQANTQGMTIINSSGDTGAAGCDGFTNSLTNPPNLAVGGPAVSYPASSQYVTGVGGTEVPFTDFTSTYWGTTNGSDGGSALGPPAPRVPEEAWNDDYEFGAYCAANPTDSFCTYYGITSQYTAQAALGIGAGGGGASNCYTVNGAGQCTAGFPQPSWQTVTIPLQASARFVPDVSLLATPNFPGFIFCTELSEWGLSGTGSTCAPGGATGITNTLALINSKGNPDPTIIGGTSVSTPVFAGMVALLNQYFQGTSAAGLGNVNPMLYTLAKTNPNNYFHQLTTGNSQEYCVPGTPTSQQLAWQCPPSGVLGFLASNSDTPTGYNLVTGLGSVDLNNLATAWAAARTTSSIALHASASPIVFGQSVTLTATANPLTATGVVTFSTGGTTLGTKPLSSGVAAISTTSLPVGADTITASYPGDGYNQPSTGTTVVNVTAPAFTWVGGGASHTVLAGQKTIPYSFTATPTTPTGAPQFTSTVTFGCTFAPTDTTLTNASCAFNTGQTIPTQIAAGTTGAVPVTLTITTTGPNQGTGSQLRHRADNRSPWLPFALPIAGVVMVGLFGRKLSKRSAIALFCFSLALLGFMVACGGSSSPPVSVTVTPSSTVQLYANEAGNSWPTRATQQQFSATVNNSSNQSVTWAVTGTSANGTITSAGVYTSPATVPSPATVTVTATSAAATTPGSGTVNLLTPTGNGLLPAPYTVTVTANEGGTSHSQTVSLTVD